MTPPENLPCCVSFFTGEVNMQNSVNKSERNSLLKYVSVRHTRLKYFMYSAKSAICSFGDRPPTIQFKNLTHQLFPCTFSARTDLSALLNYTARMECNCSCSESGHQQLCCLLSVGDGCHWWCPLSPSLRQTRVCLSSPCMSAP